MSEWILNVEHVSDWPSGAEMSGRIATSLGSPPLPRSGDWFQLVPLSASEAKELLRRSPPDPRRAEKRDGTSG